MIKLAHGEIMLEAWEAENFADILENILIFETTNFLDKDSLDFLTDKLEFMRGDYDD